MKNTIRYLTLLHSLPAAVLAAPPMISVGKIELDSLKAAYKELGEKIKADTWIAERDTTVKKNLPAVTTMVLQASRFRAFRWVHGNVKADKARTFSPWGGRMRRVLVSEGERCAPGN
ncbi:MAG: hypothetical protein IPP33_03690 [Flavobacteriales bacterium]|nr:hypothetical protein [Flavobacteriales bacterium]